MPPSVITGADILKPVSFEDYVYEIHVLENGIKALLVSSEKIDKAACGIGVNIGSLHDPLEYQGLAHFCEHMLFMGNTKYPDEAEYNQYIQKHGGHSNAFTADNETVYYGTVQPSALEGLVDRTVEFFVSPLFNASCVDREVEAVNSEFEKGLQEDLRRKQRVWKSLANPESMFSKFRTGNNATLRRPQAFKDDQAASLQALRSALIDFHGKYYSGNQMAAVVIGQNSLEELRRMTLPRLNEISNKNLSRLRGAKLGAVEKPFRPNELGKMVSIVPVREADRTIEFRFVIDDQYDFWREKPTNYLSHVLGHEGPGSLLAVLKKEGLATGVWAGTVDQNVGQSFFVISIDATTKGLSTDGIRESAALVVAAIRQLREHGIVESAVAEERALDEMRWKFQAMSEVHDLATQSTINLLNYPPELVFRAASVCLESNIRLIESTTDQILSLTTMNIGVTGRSLDATCDLTEPIYGTKYNVQDIPEPLMSHCKSIKSMTQDQFDAYLLKRGLRLPTPNKYIAERLDLKACPSEEEDIPLALNSSSMKLRVFFKQDKSFKIPNLIFSGELYLPSMMPGPCDVMRDHLSPVDIRGQFEHETAFSNLSWNLRLALIAVYQSAVTESLNEETYDAQMAGLAVSLTLYRGASKGSPSFSIHLEGFDEKADILLRTVLTRLKDFKVQPEHVKLALTTLERTCANRIIATAPYQKVQERASQILCPSQWDDEDLLDCFRVLDPDIVKRLLYDQDGKFRSGGLFEGSALEGLITGNVTHEEIKTKFLEEDLWAALLPAPNTAPTNMTSKIPGGIIDLSHLSRERLQADGQNFSVLNMDSGHNLDAIILKGNTPNKEDPNCSAFVMMQANGSEIADVAFQNLLSVWLSDKFFDDLRTRQTLGYVVGMTLQEQANRLLRGFLVQSTRHPHVVINSILTFLKEWLFSADGAVCPSITENELKEFCDAVIAQLNEKPKKLSQLHNRIYGEIVTGRYDFERRKKQIDHIKKYTMKQFRTDLDSFLSSRPWLIVALQPLDADGPALNSENNQAILPMNWFQMKDRKSIIRHSLSLSSLSDLIPLAHL